MEKLVLMTSVDRTIVAAGSRTVNKGNVLADVQHNTPIVLVQDGTNLNVKIELYSGGNIGTYHVLFDARANKYLIPQELDVKRNIFTAKRFDAAVPLKKLRY